MLEESISSPFDKTISQTFFKQNVREVYWKANYEDGSFLEQFEGEGEKRKENKYTDINREILVRFDLISVETKKAIYAVYIRGGQQLIFRRRTLKKINEIDTVIFLVGYQQSFMTGSGVKNVVVINYIHPDGSIALDGTRSNLELYTFEM